MVDETGQGHPGRRVSLYIQTGDWEHQDILVRRIAAGEDGSFAFLLPHDLRRSDTTSPNRGFILLADHPNYASRTGEQSQRERRPPRATSSSASPSSGRSR